MFPSTTLSTSTSISEEASASSETRPHDSFRYLTSPKKKRSQPGNPDPNAEVVAMSPTSLMATNRFVCEICNKGFQRDQNLQLHRRGHNLPWRLRQGGNGKEAAKKRVYVCPEPTCVHHHPSRALGDLTGIKKHFCRKHGEKKWRCDKCSKKYAVYSDWKAHVKTCGSREYTCDCGTLFSRKDSFITHRAFCDALAEESARIIANSNPAAVDTATPSLLHHPLLPSFANCWSPNLAASFPIPSPNPNSNHTSSEDPFQPSFSSYLSGHHLERPAVPHQQLSATAHLQSVINMGHLRPATSRSFDYQVSTSQSVIRLTHNFLGVDSGDLPGEQLLPMPVLSMDSVNDGRSGDLTKRIDMSGFPPATGTWGDR